VKAIDAHAHLGNFPFGPITERLDVFGGIKFSHKAIHNLIMRGVSGHNLDVKEFLSKNDLGGCVLVPLSKRDESFIKNLKIKNVFRLRFFDYHTKRCEPNGFDGYKIHPVIERLNINSEKYASFFHVAEKKRIPLLIHLGFYPLEHHQEFGALKKLENLLDEYKLKIIVCHGGGEHWKKLSDMSDNYNFFTDLSLCSLEAIKHLYLKMGAERIIFGSDYPLGDPKRRKEMIAKIASGEDLKKILYKNTLKLFC